MNQDHNTSFLDPKMILVIVFCFGILVLWQNYLQNRYSEYYEQQRQNRENRGQSQKNAESKSQSTIDPQSSLMDVKPSHLDILEVKEDLLNFKAENFSFDISNLGFGLKNISINKYKDKEGHLISFPSDQSVAFLATGVVGYEEPLVFDVQAVKDSSNLDSTASQFLGYAEIGGLKVKKTLTVLQEKYLLFSTIEVSGDLSQAKGVGVVFDEKIHIEENSIPLIPIYDTSGYYVVYSTHSQRDSFLENSFEEFFSKVALLSLDTHYFARTIIDESEVFPEAQIKYDGIQSTVFGSLSYLFPRDARLVTIKQSIFIGPKQEEILVTADSRLRNVLDYGFFSWIAHPIMDLVKFLFRCVGNWGVAIILMTLIVRIILLPFNIVSYKSMKKLQTIQPRLKALKERYKDDQENLNKETMKLMKDSGANPIGGCLPMILQIPVFVALFKVLGSAIEFYQAPFFLWITDLSEPDPYFVLPVLMALSMLLHQKLSPTTPDSNTRKVMLVVTIVFSLLMIFYPSGLALYIFIGSLFSIIQQFILMREDQKHSSTSSVEA